MRLIRLFFTLFLALLVVGCGTTKRVVQTDSEPTTYRDQKRIIYPNDTGLKRDLDQATPYELDSKMEQQRPVIKFSFEESQHVSIKGVNPLPADGLALSLDRLKERFCYPLKGELISDYGVRNETQHTGIDIKANLNDTIRAILPGVVRMSKLYSNYGNLVVIRHYDGFETVYAHNTKNLVQVNDVVEGGTPIALAGSTGRASTEHLHFELRVEGEPIDPKKLMDTEKMEIKPGMLYIERRMFGYVTQIVSYNTEQEREDIEQKQNFLDPLKQRFEREETKDIIVVEQIRLESEVQGTRPAIATESKAEYHTVIQGDTLYGISIKYKTTVAKICALNGIKEDSILRLKQRIQVR